MSVYVIFRASNPTLMRTVLEEVFPDDHLEVQDDEWLVSSSGSAKSVSDRLEAVAPDNHFGSAIVCRVSSYWGRAPTEIWDWILDKMEESDG